MEIVSSLENLGVPSKRISLFSAMNGAAAASSRNSRNVRRGPSRRIRFSGPCFSRNCCIQRFFSAPKAKAFSPVKKKIWDTTGVYVEQGGSGMRTMDFFGSQQYKFLAN